MATVATLVAKLEADVKGFEKGMRQAEGRLDDLEGSTRAADASTQGLGSKLGAVAGKAVIAGAAIGGVAMVGYDMVSSFSDLEESINAVNVQFGDGADTILAFGETAAESVGLSNSAFNQLSVVTGATLSSFITDEQEAADATIKLTERAADMASGCSRLFVGRWNRFAGLVCRWMTPRFGRMRLRWGWRRRRPK
jgi:hypothetical protein